MATGQTPPSGGFKFSLSNIAGIVMAVIGLAPKIISDVENDTSAPSGVQKKQLAVDMLVDAAGLADAVTPQYQPQIDASKAAVGQIVEGVYQLGKALGLNK